MITDTHLTATDGTTTAEGEFKFDLSAANIENQLLKVQNAVLVRSANTRRNLRDAEREIQVIGRALYESLFIPAIANLYDTLRLQANREGKGVRLKLDIQSPIVAALPWEYLYHRDDYMGLELRSPIIRSHPVPHAPPIRLPRPLRILAMIATPIDERTLDSAGERQRLEAALEPLEAEVQLKWVANGTINALKNELDRGQWDIFHYIGHGGFDEYKDEGFLALEGADGRTQRAYATTLYRLFDRAPALQLAVLNSCDGARHSRNDLISAPAAALVRRGLPAVLAMQFAIPDYISQSITTYLYEALVRDKPLEYAVADMRQSLTFDDDEALEWGVPVLYMRTPAADVSLPLWKQLLDAEKNETWDTVIEVGEVLLKRGYNSDETRPKLANAYAKRGAAFRERKAYGEAIADHNRAIELVPTNAEYYWERGEDYGMGAHDKHVSGDFDKAIQDYNRAIAIEPKNAKYFKDRGTAHYNAAYTKHPIGDYSKAIADYSKAIQLDPNNAKYYLFRSIIYLNATYEKHPSGEYTKALNDNSKAIEIDSTQGDYYYLRGIIYASMGRLVEAKSDIAKAEELGHTITVLNTSK